MNIIERRVAGQTAIIKVIESTEDIQEFHSWVEGFYTSGAFFACDTETTGLDIFSKEFRVRTLQLGVGNEAWVFPIEAFPDQDYSWLTKLNLVFHNAAYDVLAIYQFLGIELDWEKITDTKILAHLWDSRSKQEGGVGHSLQELTAAYIDPEVAEDIKGSMTRMARENKMKKSEVFAGIDLWNLDYLTYAGMDVVLTYKIREVLKQKLHLLKSKVPEFELGLVKTEHRIAAICAEMEKSGFLLDVGYSSRLSEQLLQEQEAWEAVAYSEFGTESVNANAQVAEDLIQSGVNLTELTSSGAYKLDKSVLGPLADQGHLLAVSVQAAKKSKKWRTSWVDKFLQQRDANNRCHASINPLLARTGRMSITGIPAQTLPSSDWTIRRCFIPDNGHKIVSCDYQAQELRVLAALSRDENMQRAFREGADLHQITADASGVERSVGKTVNFAYVYGSGAGNIAQTCNISVPKAREVIKGFERSYPRVARFSKALEAQAKANGYIVTPSGRVLHVDKDRSYAALNYIIQSTSRDITAAALIRLDKAGFTPYLRLPIHDEILASVPAEHAEYGAKKIASIMETEFMGVCIAADADVLGDSWGGGYVNEEDQEEYNSTFKEDQESLLK